MPKKPLITSMETFKEMGIKKVNSKKLDINIKNAELNYFIR